MSTLRVAPAPTAPWDHRQDRRAAPPGTRPAVRSEDAVAG